MKIKVDEKYFIETDKLNYILKEKCIAKKSGKEIYRTVGYYGSMTALAERYLEERQKAIMDDSTVNLDEYVKLVEESNQKAVSSLYDVLRLYPKKG